MLSSNGFFRGALLTLIFSVVGSIQGLSAEPVVLAEGGEARLAIRTPENASPQTVALAQELAAYLRSITGANFRVGTGALEGSVYLSSSQETPEHNFLLKGMKSSEAYVVKTSGDSLQIFGRSDLALQHGMFELLHQMGYRQYFPMKSWELVPRHTRLSLDLNIRTEPKFRERRLFFAYDLWPEERVLAEHWKRVNRLNDSYELATNHVFQAVITKYKVQFEKNPQMLSLVDGQRQGPGLCLSNPEVRRLVGDYALTYAELTSETNTVSVEPADGSSWCQCSECLKLGTPSDRLVLLANEVGERLQKDYPQKRVAFLSYNFHGPPPSYNRLKYDQVVTVAGGFFRGSSTLNGNLLGWSAKGAGSLGVYEYLQVFQWGENLPAEEAVWSSNYFRHKIDKYQSLGVDLYVAEANYAWGGNGFGYYFLGRKLWNPLEADYDAEREDFFKRSFGVRAGLIMRDFYNALDGDERVLLSSSLLSRLYTTLWRAWTIEPDPGVRRRLADLVAYVRYVELQRDFKRSVGDDRSLAAKRLVDHLVQSRKSSPVHLRAFYFQDGSPELKPLLKTWLEGGLDLELATWDTVQAEQVLKNGIERHKRDLEVSNTDWGDLVPVDFGDIPLGKLRQMELGYGERAYLAYLSRGGSRFEVKTVGGQFAHYRNRGDVSIVYGDQFKKIPPDGEFRLISLQAIAGLQSVKISDGGDSSQLQFPDDVAVAQEFSRKLTPNFVGGHSAYFFVPKGTERIVGYSSQAGGVIAGPDGVVAYKPMSYEIFQVPTKGNDGGLWSAQGIGAGFRLLNVPPFLGHNPRNFLVPKSSL